MSKSKVYLAFAAIGAVAPYVFFLQFFGTEGLAGNFVGALFVNGASGGFATDLFISSAVFWIFLFPESRRVGVRSPGIYVWINLLIGLSCALPLFLRARQRALDRGGIVSAEPPRRPAGARA